MSTTVIDGEKSTIVRTNRARTGEAAEDGGTSTEAATAAGGPDAGDRPPPAEATRWRVRWAGTALRGVAGGLARVSPAAAAALLELLFRRVRRHPVPERERAWLAGAARSSVELGGARLPVWSWGEGPAVLLVHGWEGRGSQMGAFAEPLAAAGFRAVAYDAPGHGDAPGRLSSLPAMIEAVAAVAAAVGPLAGVVAHSAGAAATSVALRRSLGAAGGLAPEAVVYVAPGADPGRFLGVAAGWLGLPPEIAGRTRRRIEGRFDIRFEDLRTPSFAAALDRPLLVVHDRDDREVPWEEGSAIAAAWPGARLVTTRGLGHRRVLREPEVVERAVGFVADRGKRGAARSSPGGPAEGSRVTAADRRPTPMPRPRRDRLAG